MKKFTRILPSLITVLLLLSCQKEEQTPAHPVRPRPATADQTLMFYLGGQDLSSYFRQNIAEIRQAVNEYILYDSRLLIFVQPSSYRSYLLEFRFDYDTQYNRLDTLETYFDVVSNRREGISRVLSDMAELAPASRYGLILGSHGGGWLPPQYMHIDRFGEDATEYSLQGGTDTGSLLQKSPGADPTRWFGEDGREMGSIADWADGIADSGVAFDYVIFDACFMSNIETLYDLRHTAPRIVASPCEIMARGIPYHLTLPYLLLDEGKSYDLNRFARSFYEYYASTTQTRQSGCLVVTHTAELEDLAAAMQTLNLTVTGTPDPLSLQTYENLHDKATKQYKPLFFDLRQYAELVTADQKAQTAFLEQFDRTFPQEGRFHTPSFYSGYNFDDQMHPITYYSGVTCSDPTQIEAYAKALKQTAWYRITH